MVRTIKIILLVWFTVFLQSTVINILSPWGLVPNFMLIVIALVGLQAGVSSGVWTGLLAGFLVDCYYPPHMGLFSGAGMLAGYLTGMARERIYREHVASQAVMVGLLVLIYQLFIYFSREGGALSGYPYYLIRFGLGGAVFTAVIAALVMPGLERWAYGKR
jgi:rod shape-determining protein MreD